MPKYLVIVESPAKSKTIQNILKKDYKIVASYGHVMDLPKNGLNVDLETFEQNLVVDVKKEKMIDEFRKLAQSSERIYLCSDPDREGECIAYNLAQLLDNVPKNKIVRATFNEITPKAILEAIKNPREIDMNLVNAQQARRILDRIVGYKLSPLLWEKIARGLSAGRVQSVATRIISEREKEIIAFKPEEYWTVEGLMKNSKGSLCASLKSINEQKLVCSAEDLVQHKKHPEKSLWLQSAPDFILQLQKTAKVIGVETKETSEHAYPPFNTPSLQAAGANILGFDAKRTMSVAQKLYEGMQVGSEHMGLITYMRTDSFRVSNDALNEARNLIVDKFNKEYYPKSPNFYKSKGGAQEAHECIRPSHIDMTPERARIYLSGDALKVYELIWKRFMASQMTCARFDATACDISVPHQDGRVAIFHANGRRMKFDGWRKLFERENDVYLPSLTVGDSVLVEKFEPIQHFTQPPPRFNEASLIKLLEKEEVGRPSTYASILNTIQERGYVSKLGKGGKAPFQATQLGILVTDSLIGQFPSIMEIEFTRILEESLDKIESGVIEYRKLLMTFWSDFKKELDKAKKDMPSMKKGILTNEKCPECKGELWQYLSKYGFFLQCANEECKKIVRVRKDNGKEEPKYANPTGIKCDKCNSDVYLVNGKFGDFLACEKYKSKHCDFTMFVKKNVATRRFNATKTDVTCEKCKKHHCVLRVSAQKGVVSAFLACSNYPKCKWTQGLKQDVYPKLKVMEKQALEIWKENRQKDLLDAEAFKDFLAKNQEKQKGTKS